MARKAISTGLGYLFKYYPPEELLLKAKGMVQELVLKLHSASQNEVDNFNEPVTVNEDGKIESLPAPKVKAQRYVSIVFVDVDENGEPVATIANAHQLEDGTFLPHSKTEFRNAEELIDQQVTRLIGKERDNLNVKLSHMLLPSDSGEMAEDIEEEEAEEKLIAQGPPPDAAKNH